MKPTIDRPNPTRAARLLGAALLLMTATAVLSQEPAIFLRGTVVTMDHGRVLLNGGVLVRDGLIQAIVPGWRPNPDPEAIEIDTRGLIYPGLLNIHDHNQFAPIESVPIDRLYDNRYQWQADGNGVDLTPFVGFNPPLNFNQGSSPFNVDALYARHLLNDPALGDLSVEAAKWGELRSLVAGTTTTEGTVPSPGVTDILLRNAEHTNFGRDRVCRTVMGVSDPAFQSFAEDVLAKAAAGEIDACLLHLSEGIDADSLAELDQLDALGLLQEWTVIVHGTPFGPDELQRVADAGADLVWSPTSNLRLYGQDARADLALEAGINVSLSTDWTLTGDQNLLESLKVAWSLNWQRHRDRHQFSPPYERFTAYELVQMVTTNPAASLGWQDLTGKIREGLAADLLVVSVSPLERFFPYRSLIRAEEAEVQLVMVGGDALYGNPEVMELLKPGDYELIIEPTFTKAIDTTRDGVDKGNQTLAEIAGTLEDAMSFDLPTMYATFPVVPIVGSLIGQPLSLEEFAFFFGLIFNDYLPAGTPFPPGPADLGVLFVPGALSQPLNPLFPLP